MHRSVHGRSGEHLPALWGSVPKTLEDFDWDYNRSIKKKQVCNLAAGEYVRQHRDVLLLGPPGVGKGHIRRAVGQQLIRSGCTVYYRGLFDTLRDLLHEETFDRRAKVMTRYLKPDLLILDDMGMKQLPKRSRECLLAVIMRRHELRSTMTTGNCALEQRGKLIGDVPAATAILDRLLQQAELVEIKGKSYRLRNPKGEPSKL